MGIALKRFVCLLAVLALVCGCVVDQQKEIDKYRQVLDGESPTTNPAPTAELTLEQAMALANQHNEQLGLRGEDYLQALISKDRAAANFLPQISLAPTYFVQDKTIAGSKDDNLNNSGAPKDKRLDVPVTGQANLFKGFRDVAAYRAAGRTIEQRRALLLDAQAAVLLDVAKTYYQILRSEKSVEVLRNSLKVQEERVRDIRARQAAGLVRPLDVAQTEAQASGTRVSLIAALNDVENGRAVLDFVVGVPVSESRLVDAAHFSDTMPTLEELRSEALRQRQDVLAAQAAVAAARYDVDAAVGKYYPSVTINVNYYLSRDSLPTESDWNSVLSANLPIFSAGLIEADVRTAWSLLRQAKLSESQTRRQVVQDVQLAYQNLLASHDRLHELQVQLKAADEALQQADQSYKVGLATNLEQLAAQDRQLATALQLTSERFDQKVFHLALLRATGKLSTRLPGEPATAPTTRSATKQVAGVIGSKGVSAT